MTNFDDDINRNPKKDYEPPIGDYSVELNKSKINSAPQTYADLKSLLSAIERYEKEAKAIIARFEQDLEQFSLSVAEEDRKLKNSVSQEWPETLGVPKNYVSYNFYRALRFRNTTSASYIRTRFEQAARDLRGTSALDITRMIQLGLDESNLIKEFVNEYVGNVTDVAEYRILEQFQDWVLSAVGFTRQLTTFYAKGKTNPEFVLPAEIRRTSATEAKHGQASFKIRMNASNNEIAKDIEFLERNFSDYASTFYNQFLGPAVNFRLSVSNKTFPVGGSINKIVNQSGKEEDDKLGSALTDQMRRRILYEEKTSNIMANIRDRDKYRSYIEQLAIVGKPLPTVGPRILSTDIYVPEEEIAFFEESEYQEEIARDEFRPSHSNLVDLDADDHPQYLKRADDTITGDIAMDDGITIDGIDPSEHRHTGTDGSKRIHAKDLIQGSMGDGVIDPSAKPPPPYDLSITEYTERVVPPGATIIDAVLQWFGFGKYTYEINYTRLGDLPDVVE